MARRFVGNNITEMNLLTMTVLIIFVQISCEYLEIRVASLVSRFVASIFDNGELKRVITI